MNRRFIAAALLPLAAAGVVAFSAGTASAEPPLICTSGKASATQLASPMCTGAPGSGDSGTARPAAPAREWAGYDAPVLDYADVPVLDVNGNPVLDADGNPVTERELVGTHSEHFPQTPAWQR